jgi:hypothetical protein
MNHQTGLAPTPARNLRSSTSFYTWPGMSRRAAMVGLVLLLGSPGGRAKEKWDPVPEADLAAKESSSSPGADVEILLSRQVLDSDFYESTISHHVRAKIYTPKGVEDWGRFRAEMVSMARTKWLSGRVVKPDGTCVELQKSDFHESDLLKHEDEKWKQTEFAFPNLAPGDIAECRWTEAIPAWLSGYRGFIQEEYPVREFRITIEKFPTAYWVEWQNCTGTQQSAKGGTEMTLIVRNLPAFEKEDDMPPEWDFRAGFLLIPDDRGTSKKEQWQEYSARGSEGYPYMNRKGGLKKVAADLVAGAQTEDEKLQRIYQFCQNEIGNLKSSDTAAVRAERDKRNDDRRDRFQEPADTLESRMGWTNEINNLFAGLAKLAGFEIKRVDNASRADILNVKTDKGWVFFDRFQVAVHVAGTWRFCAPGNYWVPYGMLDSNDEGVTALLCDPDKVIFETTPASPAEKSQAVRKGRFALDADGTLDGEVDETFTGHEGIGLKSRNAEKSADEVDRDFREQLGKRLPTAEVSDLHWENLRNHVFPVTVHYKVHVPGYAEQAGRRLIVAPGFFESGRPATFAAEQRKLPIFFPYAREEHDDIEIILPEGFALDHPSAPVDVAAQEKTIGAHYFLGYKPAHRTLSYKRDFVLGGNGAISFQAASYPALKKRFERLHESDTHALILKPAAENAAAPVAAPAESATATPAAP